MNRDRGVIVTRMGLPQTWDAAHGALQTYVGAEPTVFRDVNEAEYHILKTVERWDASDRQFRGCFTVEQR